jgi:hypothetical protein
MDERARRTLFDSTAAQLCDNADEASEADAIDRQYRRKRLCRSGFHYSRIERLMRIQRHRDSSMAAETALHGL